MVGLPVNPDKVKMFLRELQETGLYDVNQIYEIEKVLLDSGISIEQVKSYITPQHRELHIKAVIYWIVNKLDIDRFLQIAGTDYPVTLMEYVGECLVNGVSWEHASRLIRICKECQIENFSQMEEVYRGVEFGLSDEEIRFYARPELLGPQMKEIRLGLQNGLTIEEVSSYAKPELDWREMKRIRLELQKKVQRTRQNFCGDSNIQLFLSKIEESGKFNDDQLIEIKLGFKNGLSLEQVRFYARPSFTYSQMREIRLGFENGLSLKQIKFYAKKKLASFIMREIRLWLAKKLPFKQIKFYVDIRFDTRRLRGILEELPRKKIKSYFEQVKLYAKAGFESYQLTEILLGYLDGLTQEQIDFYARHEFNSSQMRQIRLGFKAGLTFDQVKFYANPEFSDLQMEEIRYGLIYKLSREQIETYIKPDFNYFQMREIRFGFICGLSQEQIEFYARPEFHALHMAEIRLGFIQKLTKKQIEFYARPNFPPDMMRILRKAFLKGITIAEMEYIFRKIGKNTNSLDETSFSLEDLELLTIYINELLKDEKTRTKIAIAEQFRNEWTKTIETKSGKKFTL